MQRVQCPNCRLAINVTEKIAGRKVKCKCETVIRMPGLKRPPLEQVMVEVIPDPEPSSIMFQCPSCQQTLQVSAASAGKVSRCKCKTKIRVPAATPVELLPVARPAASAPNSLHELIEAELVDSAGSFGNYELVVEDDPFASADPLAYSDPLTSQNSYRQPAPSQSSPRPAYLNQPNSNSSHSSGGQGKMSRAERIRIGKQRQHTQRSGFDSSALGAIFGGLLMMAGAVVWFVLGLMNNYIYFYPPILFVIGLVSLIKGCIGSSDS